MGMEAVFYRHAGLSQGVAYVSLQRDQLRHISAGDAGPEHARATDTRKGADTLRGEATARMQTDDRSERGRQLLDVGPRKVAEEMQRQMHPLDGIDPNDFAKRFQRTVRPGQRRADRIGNVDGKEDA